MRINYDESAIRWHLQNNVYRLNSNAVDKIVELCGQFNKGEISLEDTVGVGGLVLTLAELLEDLKLNVEE